MDWSTYDPSFAYACQRTLVREGRLTDHPLDRGGTTNFGITQSEAARHGLDVRTLTVEQAVKIYYDDYWTASGAIQFPQSKYLQAELFDTGVLCGPKTAIRLMQRAYNVLLSSGLPLLEDGVLGPKTRTAILLLLPKYEKTLLNAMTGEQYLYFKGIIDANPSQRAFIRGWVGKRLDVPDDAKEN